MGSGDVYKRQAEGHTSNLRLASALTLEYNALFLGVGPDFLGFALALAINNLVDHRVA